MIGGLPGTGIVPITQDPDTAGFFAAAREGRLVAQSCSDCGNVQQPPRHRCVACLSTELVWRDLPRSGSVHSWTVVEHQISPHFPAPYTVLLVDVAVEETGTPLRFLGLVAGRAEPAIGDPVTLTFDTVGDGIILPNWRLEAP